MAWASLFRRDMAYVNVGNNLWGYFYGDRAAIPVSRPQGKWAGQRFKSNLALWQYKPESNVRVICYARTIIIIDSFMYRVIYMLSLAGNNYWTDKVPVSRNKPWAEICDTCSVFPTCIGLKKGRKRSSMGLAKLRLVLRIPNNNGRKHCEIKMHKYYGKCEQPPWYQALIFLLGQKLP